MFSSEERTLLRQHATAAIAAEFGQGGPLPPDAPPALRKPAGAFVSLHLRGELRGCIGTFEARTPLIDTVRAMAVQAAFHDPRFEPLDEREFPSIELELSVLSPRRQVTSTEDIEVGRHGLWISRHGRGGVLLPQVAVEHGWNRLTFLQETCRKAGLPREAWKDPDTVIEVFEAEVF
ncbi:MAG: hypothetical protein A2284_06070 [Deltaproteobacteria bacterium RIFOXYA12_FULL_61_11]|nr:MAG: hypothetical protein A2284_06070 [Deltaproteobacteria bacterium RIFOXYA12_FULL_61_11]